MMNMLPHSMRKAKALQKSAEVYVSEEKGTVDALGERRNTWDFPLPRAQTTDHEPGSRLALFAKYVAYLSLLAQLKTHT